MAISLSTLEGAAIMNNTFCLSIFLMLVYFKKLAWQFSAETISILLIQVRASMKALVVCLRSMEHTCMRAPCSTLWLADWLMMLRLQILMTYYGHLKVHRLLDGMIILSFYPLSLLVVILLEGPGKID